MNDLTKKWNFFLLALSLFIICPVSVMAGSNYNIGVYYFPGWSPGVRGPKMPDSWAPIKSYKEREPLLNWYDDAQVSVLNQQLQWMHNYGINFVVFDWYWDGTKPFLDQSINAYLQADSRHLVKYSLLWANHFDVPNNKEQFRGMVQYWLNNYFKKSEYQRINGRPVVFIFSPDRLRDNTKKFGSSVRELLDMAQQMSRDAGLPGIYFVMATPALDYWVKGFAADAGFSALSAYNYHQGYSGTPASSTPQSHSYTELDADYRQNWDWILSNSKLPYFIPMTSGWDKRPWGGSRDSSHDNSLSTPSEFAIHLRAAKSRMDAYPQQTHHMGVICCWNEFGEGSYIEPTQQNGFADLEQVQRVFGQSK